MTLSAHDLSGFTGTDHWYRHGLVRSVTYTDGVKYFAENAGNGAYWFLDILATELVKLAWKEEFLHIVLKVANEKAVITADDGNGKVLWTKQISFTDAPDGDWQFYMAPGGPENSVVIMLTSEY